MSQWRRIGERRSWRNWGRRRRNCTPTRRRKRTTPGRRKRRAKTEPAHADAAAQKRPQVGGASFLPTRLLLVFLGGGGTGSLRKCAGQQIVQLAALAFARRRFLGGGSALGWFLVRLQRLSQGDFHRGGDVLLLLVFRHDRHHLHREPDLLLAAVNLQHADLDFVPGLHVLPGVGHVAVVHLADMDQARSLCADVHEGPEALHPSHPSHHRQARFNLMPFEFHRPDHGELETLTGRIETLDPNLDLGSHLYRFLYPCNATRLETEKMHQSFDGVTDVHESTKELDTGNAAGQFLTGLEFNRLLDFGWGFGQRFRWQGSVVLGCSIRTGRRIIPCRMQPHGVGEGAAKPRRTSRNHWLMFWNRSLGSWIGPRLGPWTVEEIA